MVAARKKKPLVQQKDPKKEQLIKELGSKLVASGFELRREKLKQGFGWKAVSGACRLEQKRIIFLDPRLSQDDQITFLKEHL